MKVFAECLTVLLNFAGPGVGIKGQHMRERAQEHTAFEDPKVLTITVKADPELGCEGQLLMERAHDPTRSVASKVLTINDKPGWKAGTKIRTGLAVHHGVGDDHIQSAEKFLLNLAKELGPTRRSESRDMRCRSPTLEKFSQNLTKEIAKPKSMKRMQGHGLPLPREPNIGGNLLVASDVKLPVTKTMKRNVGFFLFTFDCHSVVILVGLFLYFCPGATGVDRQEA